MAQIPKGLISQALIYPNTFRIPSGVGLDGSQFALSRQAALHSVNSQRSLAEWPDLPIVQKGYMLRPFCDSRFGASMILTGEVVFLRRSMMDQRAMGATTFPDSQAFTIVNHAQLNLILDAEYTDAIRYFAPLLERGRGIGAEPHDYGSYLRMSEQVLAAMGDDGGDPDEEQPAEGKAKHHLQQLSRAGIWNAWNLLGISNLDAAEGTPDQGFSSYYPLNVIYKGPRLVRQCWGEKAVPNSCLSFVLKRRSLEHNPSALRRTYYDAGELGAFGFHPVAHFQEEVPMTDRVYTDLSGAQQYGTVKRFAVLSDTYNRAPPSDETVLRAGGLHPDSSPSEAHALAKMLPLIDATISHKHHGRHIY